MRSAQERLLDIIDAITKIESRMPADEPTFFADELLQVWMVHHIMIIGESVRALDPAFKRQHPSIPWMQISGMRNVLVHDYFRINQQRVWETIKNDIPTLKQDIGQVLSNLPQ